MSNARLSILQARAVKDKRISDAQFRTLAALGMYADEDGWCFPALGTLGKDLGKSKQAVGRDTIALRKLGYLEVRARFDDKGSRRSSLYRLKFDLPPVNVDDSTPSTSEVDTPSTSEVDVNVPYNDSKNTHYQSGKQERPDKIAEYLKMANFAGAKQSERIDALLSYFGVEFTVNTERKDWKEFAKYVLSCQKEYGWNVSDFVKWLKSKEDFDLDFWSVRRMMEHYPRAFSTNEKKEQKQESPRKEFPTIQNGRVIR